MILLDKKIVKFGEFPNGESNLNFNLISFSSKSTITVRFDNDRDLFNLYILKKHIDSQIKDNTIKLNIPYMPYSRMDRQNDFYTFNLKYVCDFINNLNFFKVSTFDAHSDVCLALLDRVENKTISSTLFQILRADLEYDVNNIVIMFPDSGAQKRYESKFSGYNTVVGFKDRSFCDGKIESYKISGHIEPNQAVVIIDDLCSRGGTFLSAAEALKKEMGAGDIYLIVTHCEDNIYTGEFFSSDLIKKIYTSNSILKEQKEEYKDKMFIYDIFNK